MHALNQYNTPIIVGEWYCRLDTYHSIGSNWAAQFIISDYFLITEHYIAKN